MIICSTHCVRVHRSAFGIFPLLLRVVTLSHGSSRAGTLWVFFHYTAQQSKISCLPVWRCAVRLQLGWPEILKLIMSNCPESQILSCLFFKFTVNIILIDNMNKLKQELSVCYETQFMLLETWKPKDSTWLETWRQKCWGDLTWWHSNIEKCCTECIVSFGALPNCHE